MRGNEMIYRKRILLALIKKWLGIRSPSAIPNGYEFEYDMLKVERKRR